MWPGGLYVSVWTSRPDLEFQYDRFIRVISTSGETIPSLKTVGKFLEAVPCIEHKPGSEIQQIKLFGNCQCVDLDWSQRLLLSRA